jgi:hypothetical protein
MFTRKGSIVLFGLGIICLWFFVEILVLDVQASQAFINGGQPFYMSATTTSTVQEVWYLFTENLSINDRRLIIYGWGIELIMFIGVMGWEIAKSSIGHHNPKLANVFSSVAIIIIIFNFWTTANFGTLTWQSVGFAVLTAFGVAFFGVVGTYFLEYALTAKSAPATATK